jgi:hypothetical protein
LGRCHNGREILNQARPAAKLLVANVLTGLATIKPASAPPIMAGTKPQKGSIAKPRLIAKVTPKTQLAAKIGNQQAIDRIFGRLFLN